MVGKEKVREGEDMKIRDERVEVGEWKRIGRGGRMRKGRREVRE